MKYVISLITFVMLGSQAMAATCTLNEAMDKAASTIINLSSPEYHQLGMSVRDIREDAEWFYFLFDIRGPQDHVIAGALYTASARVKKSDASPYRCGSVVSSAGTGDAEIFLPVALQHSAQQNAAIIGTRCGENELIGLAESVARFNVGELNRQEVARSRSALYSALQSCRQISAESFASAVAQSAAQ